MSSDSRTAWDLIVVGGGVIGLSVAWRAGRRGLRAIVLERDRIASGSTWHAAGMIAPVAEVAPAEQPLLELGLRSAAMYPGWVDELEAATLTPGGRAGAAGDELGVGYATCGTLLVARDGDEAEALERERALRERHGVTVERLRASEARRREPALAPTLRAALELPGDHAVDPRRLCAALRRAVASDGGEVREGARVRGLEGAEVMLDDGGRLVGERVVLCPGVWGGELTGVEPVPLRPVKGQILRLHDPAGPGLVTRVIRMGSAYIVPRGDGRYVIGATSEERGFDTTVTAGAAFALLRDASELVPGIAELVVDELTAGLRPGTADNLPLIGAASADGVWWATGFYRGGVLLAPAAAELVLDLLCGEALDPLATAFDPARFPGAPAGVVGGGVAVAVREVAGAAAVSR